VLGLKLRPLLTRKVVLYNTLNGIQWLYGSDCYDKHLTRCYGPKDSSQTFYYTVATALVSYIRDKLYTTNALTSDYFSVQYAGNASSPPSH